MYIVGEGSGEMGQGELELLQETLNGNLDAWGEIVRRYQDATYGIALGVLKNSADAEEITQDAFIRAYQKLDLYDMSKKFSTWLFTITSNLAKNRLRRERFTAPLKDTLQLFGGEDPADAAERDERRSHVQEALASLDEKYRMPLVLRFYGELDYQEIADALGVPEGTIKTRIHRGKQTLQDRLTAKGVTDHA
ncbi:MAG: RNA polymerase sigma factor [Candidatus Bipolaricaulia bacterium]